MTPEELQTKFLELERLYKDHEHNSIDGTKKVKQVSFVTANLVSTLPATAANYGVFFIADRNCQVVDFYESHTVAGSNGGAVTLQLERLQGTEALDAGDELLSTALSLKATANTPQRGLLKNKVISLKVGDRLALKDAGTLTDVAGLTTMTTILY